MNAYEEKMEAKRDYYERKAAAARSESSALWDKSKGMASQIPFGQPILVGHHSERADRNFRDRIFRTGQRAMEVGKKADYYEKRAAGIGNGGISSDDPDAIEKLQDKLEKLQQRQEVMKAANRAIRMKDTAKGDAKLRELSFTDDGIKHLREPDFCGRIGFPPYELTNNNARIRQTKARIFQLQQISKVQEREESTETDLYKYKVEDNRCQFIFDGKPEPAVRTILKQHGFKWSPSRGAWVRQATSNGIFAADGVKRQLKEMEEI